MIDSNGFDRTYALKCYEEEKRFKVFAGSNRLRACKKLGLDSIPIFLYEGFTPSEIWMMAYQDQDQNSVTKPLSMIDVWLDYKAKKEQGRKQKDIAQSLGIGEAIVSYRLQLADFPPSILEKIEFSINSLSERDCRALLNLLQVKNARYDYETFLGEIIDNILHRTTNPSSKHFQKEVAKYNEAIEEVELWLEKIDDSAYQEAFLHDIFQKETRAKGLIANQGAIWFDKLKEQKEEELQIKLDELSEQEEAVRRAQEEAKKQARIQEFTDSILHGDARELMHEAPLGFQLLLIDPPYGRNLEASWRKATPKKKIANDESLEQASALLKDVLEIAY